MIKCSKLVSPFHQKTSERKANRYLFGSVYKYSVIVDNSIFAYWKGSYAANIMSRSYLIILFYDLEVLKFHAEYENK